MDIQQLIFAAHEATRSGKPDEAERLWLQLLAVSPDHPIALFHLGQQRMLRKDTASAVRYFERAAKADPKASAIPLNIALAHRALGNSAAELQALDRALALDPYCLPALLFKAAALERLGRKREAAQIYKNALDTAPPDDQLPAELRRPVAHAREAVARNAEELDRYLSESLAPVAARYAGAPLQRFEEAKEVMLGRKKIYVPQPSMLHVPHVPGIQYYDPAEFSWLPALEAATGKIREEFFAIYSEDNPDFVPYINRSEGVPLNQWAELNRSPRWSVFFFWKDGIRFEENCRRCPETAAAAERVPLAKIPNFGPNVNFSALAPRTRIPPHMGSTNARLIVHLPIAVPGRCTFRVGNETREWQEGKAWVFDDTIEHEAVNESDALRVILMLDIWNPYIAEPEREMISALLNGVRCFYAAEGTVVQFGG